MNNNIVSKDKNKVVPDWPFPLLGDFNFRSLGTAELFLLLLLLGSGADGLLEDDVLDIVLLVLKVDESEVQVEESITFDWMLCGDGTLHSFLHGRRAVLLSSEIFLFSKQKISKCVTDKQMGEPIRLTWYAGTINKLISVPFF